MFGASALGALPRALRRIPCRDRDRQTDRQTDIQTDRQTGDRRQENAGQGRTGQDRTGQDRPRQDRTRQDKTGPDTTRPDQTRQDSALDRSWERKSEHREEPDKNVRKIRREIWEERGKNALRSLAGTREHPKRIPGRTLRETLEISEKPQGNLRETF